MKTIRLVLLVSVLLFNSKSWSQSVSLIGNNPQSFKSEITYGELCFLAGFGIKIVAIYFAPIESEWNMEEVKSSLTADQSVRAEKACGPMLANEKAGENVLLNCSSSLQEQQNEDSDLKLAYLNSKESLKFSCIFE